MVKYEMIQKDIADKIERGIYRENERLPSESELIREWGVSRITVTKALTELTLAGYIYRVQGKGSFVAPYDSHLPPREYHGKGSSVSEKMLIKAAVILPGHSGSHGSKLLDGILDALPFPEYFVSTFFCRSRDAENNALDHCRRNSYSGIILFPADNEFYNEPILRLSLENYPIVLIDRRFPGISVPSVTADNVHGSREAIEHLYGLGHRRIAFIAQNSHREQVSDLRFEGYREAMAERNLPIHDYCGLKENPQNYDVLIDRIKSREITAVLACNTPAAIKLCKKCDEAGIEIPRDLSVICFDNPIMDGIDKLHFFSYIDQNSYEMGKTCADILKSMMETNKPQQSKIITPRLIIKNSTDSI